MLGRRIGTESWKLSIGAVDITVQGYAGHPNMLVDVCVSKL